MNLRTNKAEIEALLGQLSAEHDDVRDRVEEIRKELERACQETEGELRHLQTERDGMRARLEKTDCELREARRQIAAMESSSFWRLRQVWFRLRAAMGIDDPASSFSARALWQSWRSRLPVREETAEVVPWPVERPLASVVIPCYNYGRFLEEAIASIRAQTWQDYEIIVVDDGSDEVETQTVLARLETSSVRVLRQSNQKLPAARNNGVAIARGKYICCLDADDCLHPTYLEKCLARLESEGLDICYSWLREFGNGDNVQQANAFELTTLLERNCCIVPAVFARARWEQVGGYNETMTSGYEDWDFWLKLAKVGCRGKVIGEPLFFYRKHGWSMIDDARARHDALYARIRANHPELYRWRVLLGQRPSRLQVADGYANLHARVAKAEGPNVLFLLPHLVVGGAETVALHVIRALRRAGYRVTVVTSLAPDASQGDWSDRFAASTADIHSLPTLFAGRAHPRAEPSVALEAAWIDYLDYLVAARQTRCLFIASSEFGYRVLPELRSRHPHLKAIDALYLPDGNLERSCQRQAVLDCTVVENKTLLATVEPTRARLIANGVDTRYFDPAAVPDSDIRELAWLQRRFAVLFAGRFDEQKSPETVIELAARLPHPHLQFVMCGDGPLRPAIEQAVQSRVPGRVLLPGYVDVRRYLKVAQLLVLPSRWEGRPNVVLESLAMGVPVVATAVGGVPELIVDGECGWLCPPGDLDALAAGIQRLLQEPALREQMSRAARKRACEVLDVTVMQRQYVELFDAIAAPCER